MSAHDLTLLLQDEAAGVGGVADDFGVEVPLVEDLLGDRLRGRA